MPPTRPEPPPGVCHCVWCEQKYLPQRSRARTATLFCSTKCEMEARYWLVMRLDTSARG